ncbi:nitroreductase family protein [Collinsella sp. AGMB00827]|uniref:Nitroreductase family protein n=1 Tax=Collinsella ureilytica TaxID=2869515 RepID=A0ABS7MKV4_9ACTN|nr:nitroreductase family protein [Collinsella urealyticum]
MSYADLTRERYSCRSYEQRPVEQEKLDAIIEAGRIAPSAHNNHSTRLIVCDTPELRERAAKASERMARDGSIFGAPVVLIALARKDDAWVRPFDGVDATAIDSSIVVDQMMMQATDLGLGTCWVCYFDPEILRETFNLPENLVPLHMLTVGYAADSIASPERRAKRTIPLERFLDLDS